MYQTFLFLVPYVCMKLAVRIFGLEGDRTARSIKRLRKFTLNSPGISSEKDDNDGEVQETRNTNCFTRKTK